MPPSDPITVACTANAAFAMPLAVTVASLADNLASDHTVRVWILDAGLGEHTRRRLEHSWRSPPVEVRWVDADPGDLPDLPVWGRMGPETYLRILMGDLLPPDLEKVIWLDSDLVVLGDIGVLWDMPMEGHTVLAVQDLVVPYVSSPLGISAYRELGLSADTKHFNAGVLVVDLARWRSQDVAARILRYLEVHRDTTVLWDQEGLNAVLVDSWGELDPRWNQIAGVCGQPFFRPGHLSPQAYRGVVTRPLIVHFAGSLKPWLHRWPAPSRDLYFRYLDTTGWSGWRPPLTPRCLLFSLMASRLRSLVHWLELPLLRLAWRRRRTAGTPSEA